MSEGGTIKAQIEKVEEELSAEFMKWREANLPDLGSAWRMNDNEFMHHVHVLALTRVLKEHLGITEEQMELMMKQVFLEEVRTVFPLVVEARRNALITQIVQPGIIQPGNGFIKEN